MPKSGLRHQNVNFTNKGSPKIVCFHAALVSVWTFLFLKLPLIDGETWCGHWLVEKPLTLACSDILFGFWKMDFFMKILFFLQFSKMCHEIGPGIDSRLAPIFFPIFLLLFFLPSTKYPTSEVIWGRGQSCNCISCQEELFYDFFCYLWFFHP